MLTTILVFAGVIILFLAAVVLFRAALFGKKYGPVEEIPPLDVDGQSVAEHLAQIIAIPTISYDDASLVDRAQFLKLHRTLEKLYPRLHATLQRETINELSLLYTWEGRDPGLDPLLLMAHQDVVPVDEISLGEWTHPPFSGQIADGFVWGRGTLDIKCNITGILEAVETLIKEGHQPERTIYLAFGHDEEVGGMLGARAIVAELEKRDVHLAAVLDEGGGILSGVLPGVAEPVALLGNAEKGHVSVRLTVDSTGGHSSMPPNQTAIGILSAALTQVEANPFPSRVKMIRPMFEYLGPACPTGIRLAFANLWLLGGVVKRQLLASPKMAAAIRTTSAVTMISGGVKDNILPRQAVAVVNSRILPGETVASVVQRIRKVVNDPRVDVRLASEDAAWDPSPVSDPDNPRFHWVETTIRQVFPDALVVPFLVLGATDARYYARLSDSVFRFSPMYLDAEDMNRPHGVNERLSIDNCARMVRFFIQLIKTV